MHSRCTRDASRDGHETSDASGACAAAAAAVGLHVLAACPQRRVWHAARGAHCTLRHRPTDHFRAAAGHERLQATRRLGIRRTLGGGGVTLARRGRRTLTEGGLCSASLSLPLCASDDEHYVRGCVGRGGRPSAWTHVWARDVWAHAPHVAILDAWRAMSCATVPTYGSRWWTRELCFVWRRCPRDARAVPGSAPAEAPVWLHRV
jgi:hypothetical protein